LGKLDALYDREHDAEHGGRTCAEDESRLKTARTLRGAMNI
jgi:hypothetical protein